MAEETIVTIPAGLLAMHNRALNERAKVEQEMWQLWKKGQSATPEQLGDWARRLGIPEEYRVVKPLDMLIFCPVCGMQHVDKEEPHHPFCGQFSAALGLDKCDCTRWANPPHKSHLCAGCSTVFRVAEVPTNGVEKLSKLGEHDTWQPDIRMPASVISIPVAMQNAARKQPGAYTYTLRFTVNEDLTMHWDGDSLATIQEDAPYALAIPPIDTAEATALKFYADEANWQTPSSGFAVQYDPEPSAVQKDKGALARAALRNR